MSAPRNRGFISSLVFDGRITMRVVFLAPASMILLCGLLLGRATTPGSSETNGNYVLGADDQVMLAVADLDEISGKPFRVDMQGDVNLPLIGRLHAAGLTANELEAEVAKRLLQFVRNPNVVISITDFRSQPVSVLGAVVTPGIHQIQGRKSLFEVLSSAGGLRPDAGNSVRITRELQWGPIPLANAQVDASHRFSTASLDTKGIMRATDPTENIEVKPNDVISVPTSEVVYCVGSVHKPGGFTLGENESLSALQVLSLAEGLDPTAASDKARILRAVPGSSKRAEIAVNIKHLMAGKGEDIALKAQDILFIPNSAAKGLTTRTLEAVIQTATGVAVYGRY